VKILALVVARGGSKRLPGKNIRPLGGVPLILWSINVANGIPEICDILVSTDDDVTANLCKEAGALVPWLRPAALASDEARSIDVVLHALDWYETEFGSVDGLLLLQPTSPFRSRETVAKGIELFKRNKTQKTVLGVTEAHDHPMWTFKIDEKSLVPYLGEAGLNTRSQDLKPAYVVNGSFYLSSPHEIRTHKSFISEQTIPLIINSVEESIDIDTEWDWEIAQMVINRVIHKIET
jgi:CMP-N,N'-diacetyllegionaminic acid synthase